MWRTCRAERRPAASQHGLLHHWVIIDETCYRHLYQHTFLFMLADNKAVPCTVAVVIVAAFCETDIGCLDYWHGITWWLCEASYICFLEYLVPEIFHFHRKKQERIIIRRYAGTFQDPSFHIRTQTTNVTPLSCSTDTRDSFMISILVHISENAHIMIFRAYADTIVRVTTKPAEA